MGEDGVRVRGCAGERGLAGWVGHGMSGRRKGGRAAGEAGFRPAHAVPLPGTAPAHLLPQPPGRPSRRHCQALGGGTPAQTSRGVALEPPGTGDTQCERAACRRAAACDVQHWGRVSAHPPALRSPRRGDRPTGRTPKPGPGRRADVCDGDARRGQPRQERPWKTGAGASSWVAKGPGVPREVNALVPCFENPTFDCQKLALALGVPRAGTGPWTPRVGSDPWPAKGRH